MSQQAYVVDENHTISLQEVPQPTAGAKDVIIKVEAVALNPTDWKHRDFVAPPGSGLGCDFSGRVVEAGEGVTNVARGDRVAGFVHGGKEAGTGSFAEYVKIESTLVWKVPDNIDAEQAAALGGIAPHTAFQALYARLGLSRPDRPTKEATPFLVWGGSSSVGLYAIQLLKLSGYTVIATSSPKNFDLLKSFGADATYDYSDPDVSAKIAIAYPALNLALDTIAEKGTSFKVASSFAVEKGQVISLLPPKDDNLKSLPDVKIEFTLVYTVLGEAFNFAGHPFPASPEDKKSIEDWLPYVTTLIESGAYKPNPLSRQEGGLAKINEGLDLLKSGKVSAQKITYKF